MPAALSPDHDDDHGRSSWWIAFGFGHGHRIGVTTPARHHHRGRADCEPDANSVYHSRGLYLHRPPATLAGKLSHSSSRPGETVGRIAFRAWPACGGDPCPQICPLSFMPT